MKKVLIIGSILLSLVFFINLLSNPESISNQNLDNSINDNVSNNAEIKDNKQTQDEVSNENPKKLSHSDLFKIVNEDGSSVIDKKFVMTLFLEQQPSTTQVEFITQSDVNSPDTILITCNLPQDDINKLKNVLQKSGPYPSFEINVTFIEFSNSYGAYYKGNCFVNE